MAQRPNFTAAQLRDVNDLTLMSLQPGNLEYHTYRAYLNLKGHIRPMHAPAAGAGTPLVPQNTYLQVIREDRKDNKTDFRADQAFWSQDDLPDLVYTFEKPDKWYEKHHLNEPPLKTYKVYGIYLRDIPILPDHVASKIEGWRVEAWMRFDPRVTLADLMDRMLPWTRPSNKSVIQMRTLRFREDCSVVGWVAIGKNHEERKQKILDQMRRMNIDLAANSTRGLSWGLIDQRAGEAGGRIEIPENRRMEDTVDKSAVDVDSIRPNTATTAAPSPTWSAFSSVKTLSVPATPIFPDGAQDQQVYHYPSNTSYNPVPRVNPTVTRANLIDALIASVPSNHINRNPSYNPVHSSNVYNNHPNQYRASVSQNVCGPHNTNQLSSSYPRNPYNPSTVNHHNNQFNRNNTHNFSSFTNPIQPSSYPHNPYDPRLTSNHNNQFSSLNPYNTISPGAVPANNNPYRYQHQNYQQARPYIPPSNFSTTTNLTNNTNITNNKKPTNPSQIPITTVMYNNQPLRLKTDAQRARDANFAAALCREWYPYGSDGRRLQLSYLLDPMRLEYGFVDNRGFWLPCGGPAERACIDADIVYGVGE